MNVASRQKIKPNINVPTKNRSDKLTQVCRDFLFRSGIYKRLNCRKYFWYRGILIVRILTTFSLFLKIFVSKSCLLAPGVSHTCPQRSYIKVSKELATFIFSVWTVQEKWTFWTELIPKMEEEISSEKSVIYQPTQLLITEELNPY